MKNLWKKIICVITCVLTCIIPMIGCNASSNSTCNCKDTSAFDKTLEYLLSGEYYGYYDTGVTIALNSSVGLECIEIYVRNEDSYSYERLITIYIFRSINSKFMWHGSSIEDSYYYMNGFASASSLKKSDFNTLDYRHFPEYPEEHYEEYPEHIPPSAEAIETALKADHANVVKALEVFDDFLSGANLGIEDFGFTNFNN